MEWTDDGIVLGVRRHGELSAIVELLTREHGRHLGLVRGGAGSKLRPLLQPGNSVRAGWRARLDEHLGYYALEGTQAARGDAAGGRRTRPMASPIWPRWRGCCRSAIRIRRCTRRVERILEDFDDAATAGAHLVRFELAMLGRTRFRARSVGLRRDRRDLRPDLRLAEIRRRGVAGRRRAVARQAAAPAAVFARGRGRRRLHRRRSARRFCADRPFPAAQRAGAARAGPFRCAGRVHQRGDAAAGAGRRSLSWRCRTRSGR